MNEPILKHLFVGAASVMALSHLAQQKWWFGAVSMLLVATAATLYAPATPRRQVVQGVLIVLALLCAVIAVLNA